MNEKLEQIKTHIRENATTYVVGAASAVVGGAIVFAATRTSVEPVEAAQKVHAVLKNTMLFGWKPVVNLNNVVITELVRQGHPGFKVLCNETGVVFASINQAAKAMNITPSSLSKHLRGIAENAGGFTFENLGEMQ